MPRSAADENGTYTTAQLHTRATSCNDVLCAWLQLLATQEGGTFFFDEDADFVTGYTSSLRSEFVFGVPATGTDGSFGEARAIYEDLSKGTMLLLLLLIIVPLCCSMCLCL